jgi:hypothetical protein
MRIKPDTILIAIGKNADNAPIAIFEPTSTPNAVNAIGKKMIFGVGAR